MSKLLHIYLQTTLKGRCKASNVPRAAQNTWFTVQLRFEILALRSLLGIFFAFTAFRLFSCKLSYTLNPAEMRLELGFWKNSRQVDKDKSNESKMATNVENRADDIFDGRQRGVFCVASWCDRLISG